jgi:hypothetical protein
MAETTNQKKSNPESEEAAKVDVAPQMPNLLEGFTTEEIASLVRAKEDIEKGRYSDITDEHKKLLFVKWLLDHDKLGS